MCALNTETEPQRNNYMTNTELRQLRELLDLPVSWCAAHVAGGVNPRTWQYWETGRETATVRVPDDVAQRMLALEKAISKALAT